MKKLFIVALVFINVLRLSSQELISVSGEYFENENAIVSFTIGEPVTETFSGSGIVLTQGFQQIVYPFSNIGERSISDLDFRIFPNPALDHIYLTFNDEISKPLTVNIYNSLGKSVISFETLSPTTFIPMSDLATGLYLLSVAGGKDYSETLKIQKL